MGVVSVKESLIYSPKYFSLICPIAAGNADMVDRLKVSFGQYISVHSDTGRVHYSNSTYSLYAPDDKWLRTEYYR